MEPCDTCAQRGSSGPIRAGTRQTPRRGRWNHATPVCSGAARGTSVQTAGTWTAPARCADSPSATGAFARPPAFACDSDSSDDGRGCRPAYATRVPVVGSPAVQGTAPAPVTAYVAATYWTVTSDDGCTAPTTYSDAAQGSDCAVTDSATLDRYYSTDTQAMGTLNTTMMDTSSTARTWWIPRWGPRAQGCGCVAGDLHLLHVLETVNETTCGIVLVRRAGV